MKFISFLRWKLSKWSSSDWAYWIGFLFIAVGIWTDNRFVIIGVSIWVAFLLKYLIWNKLKNDYQSFLEERNTLFKTIENSDK